MMKMLLIPNRKIIRARLIKKYVRQAGYDGVVCFSRGNASAALKQVGLYTIDISPVGQLEARQWWQKPQIHKAFPNLFDATSGHLPMELMLQVAMVLHKDIGKLNLKHEYLVPTGSGETVVCLALAYPGIRFTAVYNTSRATKYEPRAPLNRLVKCLCKIAFKS